MTTITTAVLGEVLQERTAQDAKWGGADHDAEHAPAFWLKLITYRRDLADTADFSGDRAQYRRRLIQIAALAVAAVEAYDLERGRRPA